MFNNDERRSTHTIRHDNSPASTTPATNGYDNLSTLLKTGGEVYSTTTASPNSLEIHAFKSIRKRIDDAHKTADNGQVNQRTKDKLMRKHIIENSTKIKFEKHQCTTPITMNFRFKNQDSTVNPSYLHHEIFIEIDRFHYQTYLQ